MKRGKGNMPKGFLVVATVSVLFGAAVHCPAELVSISEHPIAIPLVPDVLGRQTRALTALDLPWFYEFSEGAPPPVEAFTRDLANCFSSFPAPVVHWVAAGTVEITAVELESDETWQQWLDKIAGTFFPYTLRRTEPFVEVGWGNPEQVEGVLKNLSESVPPIALFADHPGQFLTMWHHISGIEFRYETELVSDFKPIERTAGRGSPELARLISARESSAAEFMSLLAIQLGGSAWEEDGKWIIGPFRRDEQNIATLKQMLAAVKENPYNHGSGDVEMALSRVGAAALPELLQEYETADSYYFNTLTAILARIHAPERDRLFLKELEQYPSKRDEFLEHWYVPTMIEALAGNNCREAIPLIRELASNPMHETCCKIALNVFGVPMAASNPAELVVFKDQAQSVLNEEDVRQALPIFYAALDQCFSLAGRPHSATGITLEGGPVRFTGPLPDKGYWWIVVSQPVGEEVTVEAGWYTGPLSAAGYEGKAKFIEGRWLFMEWRMTWIS